MKMISSSDEYCSDIENGALEAATAIIPIKSKAIYELAYKKFVDWCGTKKTDSVSEKVLLSYFNEKSKTFKSSTMWSLYSKLKSMIFLKCNVDISKYVSLLAFLKRRSINHKPKKSDILDRSQFERFIIEAEDNHHLLEKVVLIIGIAGACRKIELLQLTTENVVDNGEYIRIDITDTKTYIPRQFIVTPGSINGIDLLTMLRRYISLRPTKTSHNRFFLGYRSGKCSIQPVGINTFASIPEKIGTFLGMNNVERLTGHCFRRSSATILAEEGASLTSIKQAGGWRSGAVAEQYIKNTLANKRKIANKILGSRDEAGANKKPQLSIPNRQTNESVNEQAFCKAEVLLEENSIPEGRSNELGNVQCLFDANAEILFDNDAMATVQRFTSSQEVLITKQSVVAPNAIAPIVNSMVSLPKLIPPGINPNVPANISASNFHGCTFNFYPNNNGTS